MIMERGIITISENGAVTIPTVPVWMTQQEMSDAFNVFGCDIRRAIRAIYKNMELLESDTIRYVRQNNGISYDVYSLEMVIAVAFKLRTKESMAFRRFVMGRLNANGSKPINLFFSLSPSRGKRAGN
ncbi:transporter [Phocaeicola barnesiae]|uniref:transporter n=1 Tax=Phocaeicola barnesiae TaxID=376804 RepID=UPI00374D68D6|nr:transporter [Phocaeicola barnesiae]